MIDAEPVSKDTGQAVALTDGVFWVGFYDDQSGLHCNPYLVVDRDEALVIDSGSRPDFPTVLMKILQTGITPNQIKALVYQHYDPDLCGSVPNFEDIIGRDDLKIISGQENLMFIRHYAVKSELVPLDQINFSYTFSSGRTLHFVETPFAHSPGSFVTFDDRSRILFSSDLFGSYGHEWQLFLNLPPACRDCYRLDNCPLQRPFCQVKDILEFHRRIMPSKKALRYALERIARIPFDMIAPQHGSIISDPDLQRYVFSRLTELEKVGVDALVGDQHQFNFNRLNQEVN
jgi:flavorubredoxin